MIPNLNSVVIDGIPLDNENTAFREGLKLILGEGKNVFFRSRCETQPPNVARIGGDFGFHKYDVESHQLAGLRWRCSTCSR